MAPSKVKLGGHIPGFPTFAVLLPCCGIAKTNPNQSNSSNWSSARSEYRMWAPDFYSPFTHTNSLPASLNGLGSHLDSSTRVFGQAFPTDATSTSRGKTIKQISIGAVAQRQEPYKVPEILVASEIDDVSAASLALPEDPLRVEYSGPGSAVCVPSGGPERTQVIRTSDTDPTHAPVLVGRQKTPLPIDNSPVSEDDEHRRLRKRRAAVDAVKATPAYKTFAAMRARVNVINDSSLQTPRSNDLTISKRKWEESVQRWRNAVKKYEVEDSAEHATSSSSTAEQAALLSPPEKSM